MTLFLLNMTSERLSNVRSVAVVTNLKMYYVLIYHAILRCIVQCLLKLITYTNSIPKSPRLTLFFKYSMTNLT